MKIQKKDFWQLSQLDRIEFRQRFENITRSKILFTFNVIKFWAFAYILVALTVLVLNSFQAYSASVNLIKALLPLMSLVSPSIIFFLIVDIVIKFQTLMRLNNLEKEYFKVEVKKKNARKK